MDRNGLALAAVGVDALLAIDPAAVPRSANVGLDGTVLGFTIVVSLATAVVFAVRKRIDRHRKLVKVAYPVWAYVSVTGVVVYGMLYHLPV